MVFDRVDRSLVAGQVLVALVVAIAAAAVLGFMAWPHLRDLSGGLEIFQLRFGGYDQADALALVGALDVAHGIAYYGTTDIVLELVAAIACFVALATLFLWLSRPSHRFSAPLAEPFRLAVFGVLAVAFAGHVVECIAVTIVLLDRAGTASAVELASTATMVKSVGYVLGVAAVLATAITAVIRGAVSPHPVRR